MTNHLLIQAAEKWHRHANIARRQAAEFHSLAWAYAGFCVIWIPLIPVWAELSYYGAASVMSMACMLLGLLGPQWNLERMREAEKDARYCDECAAYLAAGQLPPTWVFPTFIAPERT